MARRTTIDLATSRLYDDTIARLDVAGKTHDPGLLISLLAPDIVVRSPITQLIRFEGFEQASELFMKVFETIRDIRFYKVVGAGTNEQVIFWRGRVGSTYLEEANLIRLDDQGRITEMTVFMRAVPGLLALAANLAPALARKHGRWRAAFVGVQLKLVSFVYRSAEPLVIRVARVGVAVRDS